MFVGAFLERGIFTHLFRLFVCVSFIISMRRSLHLFDCCDRLFLEREIFTHFIHQFIFVGRLGVGGFRYVWRLLLERRIFTHLPRLFIYVRLIISVHGCFRAVTIRLEPSPIVAARANLATRLGSSRSVNFFRGRCTLPEVHFRYPFSRHDFRCDGRESR